MVIYSTFKYNAKHPDKVAREVLLTSRGIIGIISLKVKFLPLFETFHISISHHLTSLCQLRMQN